MIHKAVFCDRDGTINVDPGYLGDPNLVELFPGVADTIKKLKEELNMKIIVISNQSGIGRKYITSDQVISVNNKINLILESSDTSIDAFYFCPDNPNEISEDKSCRKPSASMVINAATDFNIDLNSSYFVGDSEIDVECGKNAGTKTILINYNDSEEKINRLKSMGKTPDFYTKKFSEIYEFIKADSVGGNF